MATQATFAGISAAVGKQPNSANRYDDVIKIQKLLNVAGAGLKEDGSCGAKTITAIVDYQRNFLSRQDGRVDPGGLTWRHLAEGKLRVKRNEMVLLLQQSGLGYYPYAALPRQYGTVQCIQTIRDVCAQFHHNLKGDDIGIGDISFKQGGYMSPHQTHQEGRHVDIRPLRNDKKHLPVTIADANYSRDLTKLLVESLLAHRNVKSILFNDSQIRGVTNWAGHDNHLHLTMKE